MNGRAFFLLWNWREKWKRVDRAGISVVRISVWRSKLEVKMRGRGFSGITGQADALTLRHAGPSGDIRFGKVAVNRDRAVVVLDPDMQAISCLPGISDLRNSGRCGHDVSMRERRIDVAGPKVDTVVALQGSVHGRISTKGLGDKHLVNGPNQRQDGPLAWFADKEGSGRAGLTYGRYFEVGRLLKRPVVVFVAIDFFEAGRNVGHIGPEPLERDAETTPYMICRIIFLWMNGGISSGTKPLWMLRAVFPIRRCAHWRHRGRIGVPIRRSRHG